MIAKKVRISGKVQGVYYRASARQKAAMLGVNGFIKNEEDGTVSMEIEGEPEAVNEMIEWCRHGPAMARVEQLKSETCKASGNSGFHIVH